MTEADTHLHDSMYLSKKEENVNLQRELLIYATCFCAADRERPPTVLKKVQELKALLEDTHAPIIFVGPVLLSDVDLISAILASRVLLASENTRIIAVLNELEREITDILEMNKRIRVGITALAAVVIIIGYAGDYIQTDAAQRYLVDSDLLKTLPEALSINQGIFLPDSVYAQLARTLGKNIADVILGQLSDISYAVGFPLLLGGSLLPELVEKAEEIKHHPSVSLWEALVRRNKQTAFGIFIATNFCQAQIVWEIMFDETDLADILVFLIPVITMIIYSAVYKSDSINVWKDVPQIKSADEV